VWGGWAEGDPSPRAAGGCKLHVCRGRAPRHALRLWNAGARAGPAGGASWRPEAPQRAAAGPKPRAHPPGWGGCTCRCPGQRAVSAAAASRWPRSRRGAAAQTGGSRMRRGLRGLERWRCLPRGPGRTTRPPAGRRRRTRRSRHRLRRGGGPCSVSIFARWGTHRPGGAGEAPQKKCRS
jgi:hypothetical protein